MRSSLVLLSFAALCVGVAGCDKPEPDSKLRTYDKAVDGSIPLVSVALDPAALTERPKMEPRQAPPPVQPTEPAPMDQGPNPADQVREAMKAATEKLKAGDLDSVAGLLVDDQAETVRGIIQQYGSLVTAIQRLLNVAETKLGEGALQQALGGGQSVPIDADAALAAQAMEVVSPTEVRLLDAQGQPDGTAVLIDGQWRLRAPAEGMAKLARMAEHPSTAQLALVVEQACTQLADGLESGSVTEANLSATVNALMQQQVGPAMFGFMMAMQAEMDPEQMQTTQQPAAAQPGAPSTPGQSDPYGTSPAGAYDEGTGTGW